MGRSGAGQMGGEVRKHEGIWEDRWEWDFGTGFVRM